MNYSIVSWNVNSLSTVPEVQLAKAIANYDVCLFQETRTQYFSSSVAGLTHSYSYFVNSEKRGYAGVAVISAVKANNWTPDPIPSVSGGRSVLVDFNDFAVLNVYVPHGGRDHSRIQEKLDFLKSLEKFISSWPGHPLIVAGDFNVALEDVDTSGKRTRNASVLFLSDLRHEMKRILDCGLFDSVRCANGQTVGLYSWWPYAYGARARNMGWRIDYILVDKRLALETAGHLTGITGSDHCPVYASFTITHDKKEK